MVDLPEIKEIAEEVNKTEIEDFIEQMQSEFSNVFLCGVEKVPIYEIGLHLYISSLNQNVCFYRHFLYFLQSEIKSIKNI